MSFSPKKAIAVLVAAFRQEKLSDETVALYEAKLRDIEETLLEKSIHRVIERAAFFPAIAEIRATAAELAGLLPMGAEEALAIVRTADVERPVYRRDGTYAYTEHEWQWPKSLSWEDLGVIRTALAKAGESFAQDGKRVFGWEQGFKAAYEREAVLVVAELDLREAQALSAPVAKALPAAEAPRPKFATRMLEIVRAVVDKTMSEADAHAEIQRLFEDGDATP